VVSVCEVDRRRRRQSGLAGVLRPMRQRNQTVRLEIRQGLDQHAIDHAEDGACRSDPDGEHQDRGERECRRAAQLAQSLSEHSTFLPRWMRGPRMHAQGQTGPKLIAGTDGNPTGPRRQPMTVPNFGTRVSPASR
jgi:hypothetical protein